MSVLRHVNVYQQAIIENLPQVVAHLRESNVPYSNDHLGFTPIQLAQALDRKDCLAHLQPKVFDRPIYVEKKGESKLLALSPAEFFVWSNVRYVPYLVAYSLPLLRFAVRACKKAFELGGFDRERAWIAAWYKEAMGSGHVAPCAIRWVDQQIGYGLFAREELPMHTFVGTYTGILRRRQLLGRSNDYSFRYPTEVEVLRPLLIDAQYTGNELRYANHSDHPNMEGVGVLYGPLCQILFRTKRLVAKEEQLTYDYGPDYWRARSEYHKFPL